MACPFKNTINKHTGTLEMTKIDWRMRIGCSLRPQLPRLVIKSSYSAIAVQPKRHINTVLINSVQTHKLSAIGFTFKKLNVRAALEDTRMISLNDYIQFAEHMYCSTQGNTLARLVSLTDDHVLNENLWLSDIAASVPGKCIAPLDEILISHLLSVKALHMQHSVEVFNYQCVTVAAVIKLLRAQPGTNWMLPVMQTVCLDLRVTAQRADYASGNTGVALQKAAGYLLACFRLCASDTRTPQPYSKVIGLLSPINHLLRTYFRIGRIDLCKTVIRSVEPVVAKGTFCMADQVTFRFFVGRLAMAEEDYRSANNHLLFAFRKCHIQSYKNKRIILTYLLPARMILGYGPDKQLTDRYNLPLFWELMCAVRDGQIKLFEQVLFRARRFFIATGLTSTMDNLRVITYRNVFRKVYYSMNDNTIPISHLQAGLQVMSEIDFKFSETQSLIISMIYNNKIKAYMSYQHRVVVFNPDDPFPNLVTVYHPSFY